MINNNFGWKDGMKNSSVDGRSGALGNNRGGVWKPLQSRSCLRRAPVEANARGQEAGLDVRNGFIPMPHTVSDEQKYTIVKADITLMSIYSSVKKYMTDVIKNKLSKGLRDLPIDEDIDPNLNWAVDLAGYNVTTKKTIVEQIEEDDPGKAHLPKIRWANPIPNQKMPDHPQMDFMVKDDFSRLGTRWDDIAKEMSLRDSKFMSTIAHLPLVERLEELDKQPDLILKTAYGPLRVQRTEQGYLLDFDVKEGCLDKLEQFLGCSPFLRPDYTKPSKKKARMARRIDHIIGMLDSQNDNHLFILNDHAYAYTSKISLGVRLTALDTFCLGYSRDAKGREDTQWSYVILTSMRKSERHKDVKVDVRITDEKGKSFVWENYPLKKLPTTVRNKWLKQEKSQVGNTKNVHEDKPTKKNTTQKTDNKSSVTKIYLPKKVNYTEEPKVQLKKEIPKEVPEDFVKKGGLFDILTQETGNSQQPIGPTLLQSINAQKLARSKIHVDMNAKSIYKGQMMTQSQLRRRVKKDNRKHREEPYIPKSQRPPKKAVEYQQVYVPKEQLGKTIVNQVSNGTILPKTVGGRSENYYKLNERTDLKQNYAKVFTPKIVVTEKPAKMPEARPQLLPQDTQKDTVPIEEVKTDFKSANPLPTIQQNAGAALKELSQRQSAQARKYVEEEKRKKRENRFQALQEEEEGWEIPSDSSDYESKKKSPPKGMKYVFAPKTENKNTAAENMQPPKEDAKQKETSKTSSRKSKKEEHSKKEKKNTAKTNPKTEDKEIPFKKGDAPKSQPTQKAQPKISKEDVQHKMYSRPNTGPIHDYAYKVDSMTKFVNKLAADRRLNFMKDYMLIHPAMEGWPNKTPGRYYAWSVRTDAGTCVWANVVRSIFMYEEHPLNESVWGSPKCTQAYSEWVDYMDGDEKDYNTLLGLVLRNMRDEVENIATTFDSIGINFDVNSPHYWRTMKIPYSLAEQIFGAFEINNALIVTDWPAAGIDHVISIHSTDTFTFVPKAKKEWPGLSRCLPDAHQYRLRGVEQMLRTRDITGDKAGILELSLALGINMTLTTEDETCAFKTQPGLFLPFYYCKKCQFFSRGPNRTIVSSLITMGEYIPEERLTPIEHKSQFQLSYYPLCEFSNEGCPRCKTPLLKTTPPNDVVLSIEEEKEEEVKTDVAPEFTVPYIPKYKTFKVHNGEIVDFGMQLKWTKTDIAKLKARVPEAQGWRDSTNPTKLRWVTFAQNYLMASLVAYMHDKEITQTRSEPSSVVFANMCKSAIPHIALSDNDSNSFYAGVYTDHGVLEDIIENDSKVLAYNLANPTQPKERWNGQLFTIVIATPCASGTYESYDRDYSFIQSTRNGNLKRSIIAGGDCIYNGPYFEWDPTAAYMRRDFIRGISFTFNEISRFYIGPNCAMCLVSIERTRETPSIGGSWRLEYKRNSYWERTTYTNAAYEDVRSIAFDYFSHSIDFKDKDPIDCCYTYIVARDPDRFVMSLSEEIVVYKDMIASAYQSAVLARERTKQFITDSCLPKRVTIAYLMRSYAFIYVIWLIKVCIGEAIQPITGWLSVHLNVHYGNMLANTLAQLASAILRTYTYLFTSDLLGMTWTSFFIVTALYLMVVFLRWISYYWDKPFRVRPTHSITENGLAVAAMGSLYDVTIPSCAPTFSRRKYLDEILGPIKDLILQRVISRVKLSLSSFRKDWWWFVTISLALWFNEGAIALSLITIWITKELSTYVFSPIEDKYIANWVTKRANKTLIGNGHVGGVYINNKREVGLGYLGVDEELPTTYANQKLQWSKSRSVKVHNATPSADAITEWLTPNDNLLDPQYRTPGGALTDYNGLRSILKRLPALTNTRIKTADTYSVFGKNKAITSGLSATNLAQALFDRHLSTRLTPRLDHVIAFTAFVKEDLEKSKLRANLAISVSNPITIQSYIDNRVEPNKKKKYFQAWREFENTAPRKKEYTLEAIQKSKEIFYKKFDATRARCIFNPSDYAKVTGGVLNELAIGIAKEMFPEFVHGLNKQQLEERMNETWPIAGGMLYYWDGAAHDSHQHSCLLEAVDTPFLNMMLNLARLKTDLRATDIEFLRKFLLNTKTRFIARWPNRKPMVTGVLDGTTYSGHPTRTTLGNTLRVIYYTRYIMKLADIPYTAYRLMVSGDDAVMWLHDDYQTAFENAFWQVYSPSVIGTHGLGQAAKMLFKDPTESEFLAGYITRVGGTYKVGRDVHRYAYGGRFTDSLSKELTAERYKAIVAKGLATQISSHLHLEVFQNRFGKIKDTLRKWAEKFYKKYAIRIWGWNIEGHNAKYDDAVHLTSKYLLGAARNLHTRANQPVMGTEVKLLNVVGGYTKTDDCTESLYLVTPNMKKIYVPKKEQVAIVAKAKKKAKPMKKKQPKKTITANNVGMVVPAVRVRTKTPKISSSKNNVRLAHKEYFGGLSPGSSGNFNVMIIERLNPAKDVFPWCSGIAQRFENYRYKSLTVHYIPYAAATESGQVKLAFDPDGTDSVDALTMEYMSQFKNFVEGPIYQRLSLNIKKESLSKFKRYYTSDTGDNKRETDVGLLYVATAGVNTAGNKGEVWIEYDVELFDPHPLHYGNFVTSDVSQIDSVDALLPLRKQGIPSRVGTFRTSTATPGITILDLPSIAKDSLRAGYSKARLTLDVKFNATIVNPNLNAAPTVSAFNGAVVTLISTRTSDDGWARLYEIVGSSTSPAFSITLHPDIAAHMPVMMTYLETSWVVTKTVTVRSNKFMKTLPEDKIDSNYSAKPEIYSIPSRSLSSVDRHKAY